MKRGALVALALMLSAPAAADAARPGAPGIGDPYFPKDGNGGYDVAHYGLAITYTPAQRRLRGVATVEATAKQDLSSFNLDFRGLRVRSVKVGGHAARWRRRGGELTIVPRTFLRRRRDFTTVIAYAGRPKPAAEAGFGSVDGFMPTDDGALVAGEPHGAATWFPVNEHPRDKASYSFRISVPRGLEAIANGVLLGVQHKGGRSIWRWEAREPMAPYLATATIGQFDISARTVGGLQYWDAIDPDLLKRPKPRTGLRYAVSGVGQPAYKRLMRTIDVPAGGAKLSFRVNRDTDPFKDFFFVEAHAVGSERWTTLSDERRHTSPEAGSACRDSLTLHPFLAHYLGCLAKGTTGSWRAASLPSQGYEHWVVDLSRYAGRSVEVSLSYVSDDNLQLGGVAVDDVVVSGGAAGSTSFEDDGDTLDGWTVPGAPAGSKPNPNDWFAGTVAEGPRTAGDVAQAAVAREPEIVDFLSEIFGPYPFSAVGSIVDDVPYLGFALENQTRPIYSRLFFEDRGDPASDTVVVHELAHQWAGDHVSVRSWRDVWLNEGFATYAEWLWAERQGRETAQQRFDETVAELPARGAFWDLKVGDPGPFRLFDLPVYERGAMTLHALRVRIGDEPFFRLLREWMSRHGGGNVTTSQFVALAERVSRRRLDGFFRTWLFTPRKPSGIG